MKRFAGGFAITFYKIKGISYYNLYNMVIHKDIIQIIVDLKHQPVSDKTLTSFIFFIKNIAKVSFYYSVV